MNDRGPPPHEWMETKVDLAYSTSGIEQERVSRGALGMVLAAHAGVILALAADQPVLPPVVEQAISISLVAPEVKPEPIELPKPLPVKPQPSKPAPKPVKKTPVPQAADAPVNHEPQLVAKASDEAPPTAAALEQDSAAPAAQTVDAIPAATAAAKADNVPQPKEEPIEQPRFNADYLDNPTPTYPALSRKLREEGRVLLRVRVDIGGHPAQVVMHVTSGFSRLDERAVETVRHWKFQPARQGGQPVEAWVIVPILFSLKG